MARTSLSTAQLTLCAFFTALIAILAQIAIPLPISPVPFTGQVVGVLITGALLPKRAALLTIIAYLLIGAAGIPVFSMARGGLYMLTGPGGGYLIGFMPAAFITALLLEKKEQPTVWQLIVAMLPALGLIYFFGTLQLSLLMHFSIKQTFLAGVAPFILFDLLKVALSAMLSRQIKKSLLLNRLDRAFK